MREVSTRSLKDNLSELVHEVEAGEQLIITRSGRPVAALVPLSALPGTDAVRVLTELAARGVVRAAAVVRPPGAFAGATVPARGVSATDMVLADRR